MDNINCGEYWENRGITDVNDLKDRIDAIFERHDHQEHVLIDLYRMVFPDWDRIRKIRGYPEAGSELWKFICRRFQEFDRTRHPDCLPGGAWMNTGFSVNRKIGPWDIGFENCTLIY